MTLTRNTIKNNKDNTITSISPSFHPEILLTLGDRSMLIVNGLLMKSIGNIHNSRVTVSVRVRCAI